MDIKGCTAIVTGGTGGLGNRLARKFAEAGANIALVYKESDDKAEEIAAELRGPDTRVVIEGMPSAIRRLVNGFEHRTAQDTPPCL